MLYHVYVRYLMASAKDIIIKPISSFDANRIIKLLHYSHKVVNNMSQEKRENSKGNFRGMNPKSQANLDCDVTIKRWEDYTGKKAELIL